MGSETEATKPTLEAWYMNDTDEDQRLPHHCEPPEYASLEKLAELGVLNWHLDADKYETDENLERIRKDRGYNYTVTLSQQSHLRVAVLYGFNSKVVDWVQTCSNCPYISIFKDLITCCPEKLPNYHDKLRSFFEEHIHTDEEIRYCLEGSGYFDVRDQDDRWIRLWVKKGDLIVLPAGIYHRFTLDASNYIKAMRLFVGEPVWTPYNRPQDDHPVRKVYIDNISKKGGAAVEAH